jgi:flavin-dependent dehydrogenase
VIDLAVVGGGPVGLVTALEAASHGLAVTVLEARDDDGDKACGEGLMPSALAGLARLGVDPPGMDIAGMTYVRGRHRAEARFDGPPGRGVRRTALVAALRERAASAGVVTVPAKVGRLEPLADGLRAGPVEARYVAVADGLHSPLRRSLGLHKHGRGPARYGLRQHLALAPWSDCVEVHWADTAEAYVTPVGEHTVGVAVLGDPGASFAQRLAAFPTLADRLGDAPPASRVRGAGPLRQSASARVLGRALLVGDAAGYVDALTGEGMAVGFAAAHELVRCVSRDDPGAYETAWARVTRRPRWLTEALLRATRVDAIRRGLVPAAQRAPRVFSAAVHVLA